MHVGPAQYLHEPIQPRVALEIWKHSLLLVRLVLPVDHARGGCREACCRGGLACHVCFSENHNPGSDRAQDGDKDEQVPRALQSAQFSYR